MARRVALLVATDRHDDPGLRRLTAPAADAEALAAVLRDPEIAGFEVTVLVNQPHHVVGPAIGDLYRDRRRDDVTLLYFTGHGLKDDHGRLYLATTNTRRDSLLFTSIPAEQIDQAMEGSTSRQKILILDCCYSGAFPSGRAVKADDEVHALERFQGRGRTVLTASDSTQYSFEGDRVTGSATRSVFTHHLVQGLRTGDADLDRDGDITVDELYSYVHDKVVEEQPRQRPKKQTDVEGRAVIARNVAWTLPGYLRNAILSPIATDRLGALDGLVHLHRVGNPAVREQVVAEIERLTGDDSRAVSAAAAARLAALRPPAPEEPAPEPLPAEPLPEAEAPAEAIPTPEPPEPDRAGRPWWWRRPRPVIIIGAAVAAAGTAVAVALTALTTTGYPSTGPIAAVVDTVAVGDGAAGIDFFGNGGLAAVAIGSGFALVEIGATTNTLIGTDVVPGTGTDVVVLPDGSRTYVATSEGATAFDTSGPLADNIGPVVSGTEVFSMAAVANGTGVLLATEAGVVVVDPVGGRTVDTIPMPGQKFGMATNPRTRRAYVANTDVNAVTVLDTETNAVVDTILTGAHTSDVAISSDGARGYVAQQNAVAVFRTDTNTVVSTIQVPGGGILTDVAVTPDGRRAYAIGGSRVFAIDVTNGAVLGNLMVAPSGGTLGDIAIHPDGRRAYVTTLSADTLTVLDLTAGA